MKLTPDTIRDVALNLLSQYPEGIKQSELINNVQMVLEGNHIVPNNMVKNSLWNLDERRPGLVEKKKYSSRNVFFLPTKELMKRVKQESEDLEIEIETDLAYRQLFTLMRSLKGVVNDRDMIHLLANVEQALAYHSEFYLVEVEAILGIKHSLEMLKQHYSTIERRHSDELERW